MIKVEGESELEFLESLFKADDKGIELQFFKDGIYHTKFRIYQRILKLRKLNNAKVVGGEK